MALRQTRMSTPNTDETDLASDGRIPNSEESVTLNIVEGGSLGGKEDGPVISTLNVDDYPDGGLAAWSVVLGVSPLTNPSLSEFTDQAWSCSLRVPSSRRRSHSTDFVPNHRFTSNYTHRFGLVNSWGVRHSGPPCLLTSWLTAEIGISIVLRTGSHTRDSNVNNVSAEFFTLGLRPKFDLMSERQRMDWIHSGTMILASQVTPS